MMTSGPRKFGEFCWINILTPQPAAAREFFAQLLGWTYVEMPGVGHLIQVADSKIGGLFDLDEQHTAKGTPAQIGVMVKVESADATAAKVIALGGRALAPFDIGENGRMAVCFDPNGAGFDLWQPKQQDGTDVHDRQHGAPSWFETLTTDVVRGAQFYAALFGWTPETVPMPGVQYIVFKRGETHVAGSMQMTPQMGPVPPHWATYFTVDDADVSARLAVELDAQLVMPVTPIPGIGRFCGVTSPQGVTFWLMEYAG